MANLAIAVLFDRPTNKEIDAMDAPTMCFPYAPLEPTSPDEETRTQRIRRHLKVLLAVVIAILLVAAAFFLVDNDMIM